MPVLHTSVAACTLMLYGCANVPISFPTPGSGGTGTTAGSATAAAEVVAYTNEARARNGLRAFTANARLMEAARLHAEQMAARQEAVHTIGGAKYPTMQSRLDAVGYAYSAAAENIAWNQRSAQEALNTWMGSSGHRANILDESLTEIGAAMARSSRGEPYWIQVFGRPR